jgi:hypothetical protein
VPTETNKEKDAAMTARILRDRVILRLQEREQRDWEWARGDVDGRPLFPPTIKREKTNKNGKKHYDP